MSKKRIKQYLMLLTVIGLVAIASGSGTFATFSAEVTNANNTFASGTLFLHENGKDSTGAAITQCNSESGALNVNNSCQVLFPNVDLSQGAAHADIALTNAGSINASGITFKVGNCTINKNNAAQPAFITTPASDCSGVYVTVQETQSNYTTNLYCAYGSDSSGTCAAPSSSYNFNQLTSLTPLDKAAATQADLAAGNTRYYVITVDPSGIGTNNQLQNLKLSFDLTWHLDQ